MTGSWIQVPGDGGVNVDKVILVKSTSDADVKFPKNFASAVSALYGKGSVSNLRSIRSKTLSDINKAISALMGWTYYHCDSDICEAMEFADWAYEQHKIAITMQRNIETGSWMVFTCPPRGNPDLRPWSTWGKPLPLLVCECVLYSFGYDVED